MINELRSDNCVPSYATSVLAFVNCLIVGHDDIHARIRIRNELIGIVASYTFFTCAAFANGMFL